MECKEDSSQYNVDCRFMENGQFFFIVCSDRVEYYQLQKGVALSGNI